MNLIEPLHSALVEREKQREAARKRYVDLIRQATYHPEKVNAKDQQEFTDVCNLLNIPVDQALRDLNSAQVVKRTEENMALHIGHTLRQKEAKQAMTLHSEETKRINAERAAAFEELRMKYSRVMDIYLNAQAAGRELEKMKSELGDLGAHIVFQLTE